MYKRLSLFAAAPQALSIPHRLDEETLSALSTEFEILDDNSGSYVALQPAVGRFGEFFLHVILSEYFDLNCIIPKVSLTTDPNMSVFGIDALFYSANENMIYFGESKFTKALSGGISLIRKSLDSYETQIDDEFVLVLSERHISRHPEFEAIFGQHAAASLTFKEFANRAGLTSICVPLFITHGEDADIDHILSALSKIPKKKLFGLDTKYWGISLPIVSKDHLINELLRTIEAKRNLLIEGGSAIV